MRCPVLTTRICPRVLRNVRYWRSVSASRMLRDVRYSHCVWAAPNPADCLLPADEVLLRLVPARIKGIPPLCSTLCTANAVDSGQRFWYQQSLRCMERGTHRTESCMRCLRPSSLHNHTQAQAQAQASIQDKKNLVLSERVTRASQTKRSEAFGGRGGASRRGVCCQPGAALAYAATKLH
eukprot:2046450-Rhodomonas_salina.3